MSMMKLAFTREGSGPPLVLIHGLGSATTAWRLIIPGLANEYDVIAFDLPGHGQTPYRHGVRMDPRSLGELVIQNLDAFGVETFDLVGSSLGGWVALEIAAAHPDRVNSVTALAPAGLWHRPYTEVSKWTVINRTMAVLTLPFHKVLIGRKWAKRFGFQITSPRWEELPDEICLDAGQAMGRSHGYLPALEATLNRRFDSPIDPKVPVTVVFGDTDRTLPSPRCQARELVPVHAKWVILERTGHAPMWDEPNIVVDLIKETRKAGAK